MKKTRRLLPCSIYDVPAMETWLFDMARNGLALKKTGRWYFVFAREQPSCCCFRLEPVTGYFNGHLVPDCEMRDSYAEAGWEFVTDIQKLFYVWRSVRPDAQELHSDPVVHSGAYGQLYRRIHTDAVISAFCPVFLLALFLAGVFLSPRPVNTFLINPFLPFLITIEVLSAIQAVRQAYSLKCLKQSLADGLPAAHQKNYRKGMRLHRAAAATSLLMMIFFTAMAICTLAFSWEKNISDVKTAMPYLPLDMIEQSPDFSRHKDAYDAYNRASYTWSLFVPVHYDIYEQGEIQHVIQNNDSIAIDPSARTEYFRLLFPFLAKKLCREQVTVYSARYDGSAVTEYACPGFDLVAVAKSSEVSQLFACRGSQVLHIRYWGSARLEERLNLVTELFAQF